MAVSNSSSTRLCIICDKHLSSYNRGDRCFHHHEDDQEKWEEELIVDKCSSSLDLLTIVEKKIQEATKPIPGPVKGRIEERFSQILQYLAEDHGKDQEELLSEIKNYLATNTDSRMPAISFDPYEAVANLLASLKERHRNVIEKRFGIFTGGKKATLQAVASEYGVCRYAVSLMEAGVIRRLSKSLSDSVEMMKVRDEIVGIIGYSGGIMSDADISKLCSGEAEGAMRLLLAVCPLVSHQKSSDEFREYWYLNQEEALHLKRTLRYLYQIISEGDLVPQEDLILILIAVQNPSPLLCREDVALRWLTLSKRLAKNPLGYWGKANSRIIRARWVRDQVYLALREKGVSMHIDDLVQEIRNLFGRRVHRGTLNNELIRNPRYVLVGRGIYALSEWGFKPGTVKDVICDLLEEKGPLTREQIIADVLTLRKVKELTIIVSLYSDEFRRDEDGRYYLSESLIH